MYVTPYAYHATVNHVLETAERTTKKWNNLAPKYLFGKQEPPHNITRREVDRLPEVGNCVQCMTVIVGTPYTRNSHVRTQ